MTPTNWYVLNYIPPRGHNRRALPGLVAGFDASLEEGRLELFAPTFFTVVSSDRGPRRVERPLLYHYVFIRGQEKNVKLLCSTLSGFSFVLDHREGSSRYLTIPDATMEAFRTIARLHGNRLECYSPQDIGLEEGDKVEIVTGQFAGLSGTYIPRKGGRTGNIYIAVTQQLGTVVYDIPADCVRVIEFAPATRRPYDQMDAYIPRLLSLLGAPGTSATSTAAAIVFTRRFCSVKLGNPKVDAKLRLMLYASYRLLGEDEKAEKALVGYRALESHITNVWTQALVHLVFGLLDGDSGQLAMARALITPLPAHPSAQQRLLIEALN